VAVLHVERLVEVQLVLDLRDPGGATEPARERPRHLVRPGADEVEPEHDNG
jgi:hypothetical protein